MPPSARLRCGAGHAFHDVRGDVAEGDLFLGAFVVVFVWKYWVYRRSRNQSGADAAAEDASREPRFEALRRAADAAAAELAQRESQAQKPSEPRV